MFSIRISRALLSCAIAAAAFSMLGVGTAEAGMKRCVYMAHNPSGQMMADGWAYALKQSRACNRAERRCKRELERKRRHGKAGRGHCQRISNL